MTAVDAIIARLVAVGLLAVVERHAKQRHVAVADVCGRGRTAAVVAARHAAWAEIRHATTLSFAEVGSLFGCEHGTVISGIRKAHARAVPVAVRGALRVI